MELRNYNKDTKKVVVKNCYDIKEQLKEGGFKYNALSQTWEKTIDVKNEQKTKNWLNTLSCEYEILDGNTMQVEAVGTLIATDGSFEYKDELKANGFYWNSQKKRWQKKINMQDYQKEMYSLRNLQRIVKIQLEKPKKK